MRSAGLWHLVGAVLALCVLVPVAVGLALVVGPRWACRGRG